MIHHTRGGDGGGGNNSNNNNHHNNNVVVIIITIFIKNHYRKKENHISFGTFPLRLFRGVFPRSARTQTRETMRRGFGRCERQRRRLVHIIIHQLYNIMCTMGPPLHTDKCRRAARISRLRFFFLSSLFIVFITTCAIDRASPAED